METEPKSTWITRLVYLILALTGVGAVWFSFWLDTYLATFPTAQVIVPEHFDQPVPALSPEQTTSNTTFQNRLDAVPFLVQAPRAQWGEELFQNACEEVSMLMVANFFQGVTMSVTETETALRDIARWQQQYIGTSIDTNTTDTARTLTEYFSIENFVAAHITETKLQELVSEGNIVLAPTNGRLLNNPYYTPPGPETHMLVLLSYDPATNTFTVQDPGTRHGEHYQYTSDVLYGAIRDYPTGNHIAQTGDEPKSVIVVPQ